MTPGEAIKERLERKGWTQSDLAAVVGMSRSHVSDVIRGARGLGPEMALRLAAAFGTEPEYWLRLESALKLAAATERARRLAQRPRKAQAPLAAVVAENAILRAALSQIATREPGECESSGGIVRGESSVDSVDCPVCVEGIALAREALGLESLR